MDFGNAPTMNEDEDDLRYDAKMVELVDLLVVLLLIVAAAVIVVFP